MTTTAALSKADREFLEQLRRDFKTPMVPHSGQVQDLYRDGLIEIRAVLTDKGRAVLKEGRK